MAFDLESVATAVANSTRPVLSGIGHEIDRSIVDEVAHTAYKTPTACAAALVHIPSRPPSKARLLGATHCQSRAVNSHDRASEAISYSVRAIGDRARRTLDIKEERLIAVSGLSNLGFGIDNPSKFAKCLDQTSDLLQASSPRPHTGPRIFDYARSRRSNSPRSRSSWKHIIHGNCRFADHQQRE